MKTLIIDAGHGGTDTGARAFGYSEKDLNLVIAKRVAELLKQYNPDLTRVDDADLGQGRVNLIKDKYEFCLSIHFNAANGKASGIETIHSIYSKTGERLAQAIAEGLKKSTVLPLRRVFSRKGNNGDYYYMHRLTGKTCTVIVECLFMDNTEDIKALNIENISQGIAEGFRCFMKQL